MSRDASKASQLIALVLHGEGGARVDPTWDAGAVIRCRSSLVDLSRAAEEAVAGGAGHVLFWSAVLDGPEAAAVRQLIAGPGDAWHAGLLLGTGGLPEITDFVQPNWMLNVDADASSASSSWRLSLDACLLSAEQIRQLGFLDPAYHSLVGAGLDLGFRYNAAGVMLRHDPRLLPPGASSSTSAAVPVEDEFRFARRAWGGGWALYALWRMLRNHRPLLPTVRAAMSTLRCDRPTTGAYARPPSVAGAAPVGRGVTVVIPTLDRYAVLGPVLDGLARQTVPVSSVVVVDQSSEYDPDLASRHTDLPLTVLRQVT
ncbi:MAG: putative glycosyltransferase, partial [Solirubrobacteraceae bacterium]|nr:putative glycosyltransferase [Solirubrobacteraceae bacterium]